MDDRILGERILAAEAIVVQCLGQCTHGFPAFWPQEPVRHLIGILFQIEQAGIGSRRDHQLVLAVECPQPAGTALANPDKGDVEPIWRSLAGDEQDRDIAPLVAGIGRQSQQFLDRRFEVDVAQGGVDHRPRLDLARGADHKGDLGRGLEGKALGVAPMLAAHVAVIGGEDDVGIVQQAILPQLLEDLADIVVDAFDHAEILCRIAEPVAEGGAPGWQSLSVLLGGARTLEIEVFEHGVIGGADGSRGMGIGKTDHVAEWLFLVRLDERDRLVGEEVGGEGFLVGGLGRPVVLAADRHRAFGRVLKLFPMAAVEHVGVVLEAELPFGSPAGLGAAIEMPFAGIAGGIALEAEDFGKGDDHVGERLVVADRPGVLRIAAGQQGRPRRGADWRGGIELVADGAVFRQRVDVGSRNTHAIAPDERQIWRQLFPVAAKRAEIELVAMDDQQVGLARGSRLGRFLGPGGQGGERGGGGQAGEEMAAGNVAHGKPPD